MFSALLEPSILMMGLLFFFAAGAFGALAVLVIGSHDRWSARVSAVAPFFLMVVNLLMVIFTEMDRLMKIALLVITIILAISRLVPPPQSPERQARGG